MRVRAVRDHFNGCFRRAGDEFEHTGEIYSHVEPVVDVEQLRERFHKVILGVGYSERAAQMILEEYFTKYLEVVLRVHTEFVAMLESYEQKSQHRGDE